MAIFGNSTWRIETTAKSGLSYTFTVNSQDCLVEKTTEPVIIDIDNSLGDLYKIKKGNRTSWKIQCFGFNISNTDYRINRDNFISDVDFTSNSNLIKAELSKLDQIDGTIVKFYPHIDYPNQITPDFYYCWFWWYYDDCSKAPLDFAVLNLTRLNLEHLDLGLSTSDSIADWDV